MTHEDLIMIEVGDWLQCCDNNEYFEVSKIVEMKGYNRTLGDIVMRKFYFKDNAHLPATEPFITNFRLTESENED